MPNLVKGDDVRGGRKAQGSSRPVTAGTGVNGLKEIAEMAVDTFICSWGTYLRHKRIFNLTGSIFFCHVTSHPTEEEQNLSGNQNRSGLKKSKFH